MLLPDTDPSPHAELFYGAGADNIIRIACDCQIGSDHTYDEWMKRFQIGDTVTSHTGDSAAPLDDVDADTFLLQEHDFDELLSGTRLEMATVDTFPWILDVTTPQPQPRKLNELGTGLRGALIDLAVRGLFAPRATTKPDR